MNLTQTIPFLAALRKSRYSAQQVIGASDLPEPIKQLVLQVVRTTRLWKREKADVAIELVAHFQDGLEAARPADDLIATFGSPIIAAKLIRRAKKRNRPVWWRALLRFIQGLTLILLLYITAALLLAIRQPNPSVDYVAAFNRMLPEAPVDQQAWPIYRKALLADPLTSLDDIFAFGAKRDANEMPLETPPYLLQPSDPAWPKAVALLQKHHALLEAARKGGLKPVFGLPALPAADYSPADQQALSQTRWGDLLWKEYLSCHGLQAVPWAFRFPQQSMVYLLAMDTWFAADHGDVPRVLENYHAMIGMASQCAKPACPVNTQTAALVILNIANQTLAEVNHTYPHLLDGRRLELLHTMAGAATLFDLPSDLPTDRLAFEDLLQQIYSDNGHGNGAITYVGIGVLWNELNPLKSKDPAHPSIADKGLCLAALPVAVTIGLSRKQTIEAFGTSLGSAEHEARQPLWKLLEIEYPPNYPPGSSDSKWFKIFHNPLQYFSPARRMNRFAVDCNYSRALHEAVTTALALDVWREHHGSYPLSLADLVPQYLPQPLPIDLSTGQPLRYKLQAGLPLLYGLGLDHIDNGGVSTDKPDWSYVPSHGDWILYPSASRY